MLMEDWNSGDAVLPYFGYGTLLGASHMRERYPSAESLGLAFYDRHQLAFLRYATALEGGCAIVENPDAILFGVLYKLSVHDKARLLEVGGQAHWYEARKIEVTRIAGGRVRAITLLVDGDRGSWIPPNEYARQIIDGAIEANLPYDYRARLDAIIAEAQQQSNVEGDR
jgi:hypothetical protein